MLNNVFKAFLLKILSYMALIGMNRRYKFQLLDMYSA